MFYLKLCVYKDYVYMKNIYKKKYASMCIIYIK